MVNTANYFEIVKSMELRALPAALKEGYDFVHELTEGHRTWKYYTADTEIKAAVNKYFADLSGYLQKDKKKASAPAEALKIARNLIRDYVLRGDSYENLKKSSLGKSDTNGSAQIRNGKIEVTKINGVSVGYSFSLRQLYTQLAEERKGSVASKGKVEIKEQQVENPATSQRSGSGTNNNTAPAEPPKEVERVSEAITFIKRYALLHDKIKTNKQILNFINAVQKAILEKRIRKTDAYAKEIAYIQENLLKLHDKMGSSAEIKVRPQVLKSFREIAGSQSRMTSVQYLKRYIGIQGKHINKDKAVQLVRLIEQAIVNTRIKKTDPYYPRITKVVESLKRFVAEATKTDTLSIHQGALNGIEEALSGICTDCKGNCSCHTEQQPSGLSGLDRMVDDSVIVNSLDFADMQFETLGFKGKWKEFMGDPAPGFTAMVSAFPKMGKSYWCAEFAGYLARNHGKTLFVAREEKLSKTLQQKIESVKHPMLDVTGDLPDNLNPYKFVILDSVSRLGLTTEDLRNLKEQYPGIAFVRVHQVIKTGKFRGTNEAEHDVDIVVQIPEKGRAIQFGRYNQGGEMDIFSGETN